MTQSNFRALCAELVNELHAHTSLYEGHECDLVTRARAALAQPEPQVPMPEVDDILRLAAIIRRVDGNHDKGAAALAEAILSHPDSRWQHAQPAPQGPTDEEIYELALDGDFLIDIGDGFSCAVQDEVGFARAVLARFGRPAIEPVPVTASDIKELRRIRRPSRRV